jgi:phosphate transport system substrate-binding protein
LTQQVLDKENLFQFPAVIGVNVIVYNIVGVNTQVLKLDDATLASIFLGKINKWNDPSIVKLNPTLKLPNAAINVVRRSDGSGTTFIFTRYLSSVSEEWKNKVGQGTAIEWPVGVGARGNEGVTSNVGQTRNSIGYVEYAYAKQNKISYSMLNGVLPSIKTFQTKEWPITAPTFIIMHKKPGNPDAHKIALSFFSWAFNNGDKLAEELDYVPLSTEEKNEIIKEWNNNE